MNNLLLLFSLHNRMPKMEEKKGKSPLSINTTATKTRKTKIHKKTPSILTLFSLTLAALKNPQNPCSKSLLVECSYKFLSLFNPKSQPSSLQLHFNLILSLLPHLLYSIHEQVVCTVVQIVGSASLISIEVNERIAMDVDILKGLVANVFRVDKMAVKKAVCNSVLDLSVSSLGCQRLLEVSALNYLMLGFLQVQNNISTSLCLKLMKNACGIFLGAEHGEDEVLLLLLNAAVILTNFCNSEQLKIMPRRLKEVILPHMREIRSKVHEQLSASKIFNMSKVKHYYMSNLTVSKLAESIFRLSMDGSALTYTIPLENIVSHIFRPCSLDYKSFILGHWESSPFVIRSQPKDAEVPHVLFSSLMHSLTCEEALPRFLCSILRGMVSCPPFALNEIDSLSFLNDVQDTLGSPMIYQQDIRVVRTRLHSKFQEHYLQESSGHGIESPRPLFADDIPKCMAAYEEGYTIALRGMGFRFSSVAEVTREMASIFGQPSVGANLYVTPPNSQGLSCHYDDHCVFVCQLYGGKQWEISPEPIVKLPRLYECLEVPQDSMVESRRIFLGAGDVLYLPRGFAHKANTVTDLDANSTAHNSSVHLTLAIEVEPPFEWEGFAHVALYQWSHKIGQDAFPRDTSGILLAVSLNLLHVSIRLISYNETIFRKACLVASNSLPTETIDWLDKNQRNTFDIVLDKINELSSFTESLNFLQMAIQRDDDPFHWLRWLEHLDGKEAIAQGVCDSTSDGICKVLPFIYQHRDDAEATFAHFKSKFCDEVLFDDVKERFITLHSKYKDARLQYMNGMISLHC